MEALWIYLFLLSRMFGAAGDGITNLDTNWRTAWALATLFGAVAIIASAIGSALAATGKTRGGWVCDDCTARARQSSMAEKMTGTLLCWAVMASETALKGHLAGYKVDLAVWVLALALNVAAIKIHHRRRQQAAAARWDRQLQAFKAADAQERIAFVTAVIRLYNR